MTRKWGDEPVVAEPLPEPEIPKRLATVEEADSCASAKALQRAALGAGWDARMTFSRGTRIDAGGKFLDVRDCIVVAGQRKRSDVDPIERFVALWMKDLKPKAGATKIGWTFDHAHYIEGRVRTRVNGNEIKGKVKS